MSDIGILSGPSSLILLALIFGGPGLAIGAVAGALAWRRHRVWGAAAGAVLGFAGWLAGWLYFSDNL